MGSSSEVLLSIHYMRKLGEIYQDKVQEQAPNILVKQCLLSKSQIKEFQ